MEWNTPRVRRWLYICSVLLVELSVVSAHAQWLRAESDHVVVYGDADEEQVRAFVRKLERFHALLEYRLPGQKPDAIAKLTVYLVSDGADLRRALPGLSTRVDGIYSPSADGIHAIAIAHRAHKRDDDDALMHEYTHHFMAQRFPQRGPTWATEGLAEYFSTADVVGTHITVGKPNMQFAFTLSYAAWLDFADVLTGSPWQGNAEYTHAFYAQSWLLTHYLLQTNETASGDAQRASELLAPRMAGNASSEQYYLAGRAQLALATHLLESPGGDGKGANDAYVAAANDFAQAIQGNDTDYRALYRYLQIRVRNGAAPHGRAPTATEIVLALAEPAAPTTANEPPAPAPPEG